MEPSRQIKVSQQGGTPDDAANGPQARNWLGRLAWLPIPVLLVAMAVLWAANLPGSYGSNSLIMVLNFVFTTLASGLIVLLVSRSFLIRGTPGLLLLDCGVLTWGAAGLLAKMVYPRDANVDVTIHNSCVWLSALFHFAGALLLLRPGRALQAREAWLGAAYAAVAGILGLLVLSALHGYTPTFFVQGAGGTIVRQWVLASAIAMFLATAGLLKWSSRRPLSAFLYWYILALCLIALGLLGIMIESVFASPLSWVGLTAQYLSGVYMLIAAIASVRESGTWHISLEAALRQSEERFRLMVENVKDYAIFMLDLEGRVTSWNSGAQHVKGYAAEEIVGQSFTRFYRPEDVAAGKPQRELAIAREQGQYSEEGWRVRKDGSRFWANVVITALRDEAGRLRGFAKLTQDRSEQRQMADRVASLAQFPEENPYPVLRIAPDGHVLYANAAAKALAAEDEAARALGTAGAEALRQGAPREFDLTCAKGKVFSFHCVPLPEKGYANLYGRDVTDARQAEAALRESERLQGLLARIGELAATCTQVPAYVEAVGECVAEHLGVSRCGFSRVDMEAGQITVISDYHSQLPSLAGAYPMQAYADYKDDALAGRTVFYEDTAADPRTAAVYQSAYAFIQVRAHLTVPLIRDGQWVANFWVSHHEPRHWTTAEVHLMQAAADRVWTVLERKRADEALSQSQKTFFELIERSPFGTYIVDSQFRIAQMNAGSQAGAFQNVRPVIGRDFGQAMRILWPEPVAAEIIAAFRHTLDTGEPYYSPRFMHSRQDVEVVEAYEWELHRMMLPDGQYGVICYYYDSTKLRTAEAALRQSEERYRSLFGELLEGFCIIEVLFDADNRPIDFRYLETNPAFEGQTGWPDAKGKRVRELAPELEAHWFDIYGKVALTGEPARFVNEVRPLNRWYDVSAYRVGGPDSRKVAVLFNDISEAKRAENALQRTVEELARSNKDLEQFAYVASHDLQEPLRMVTGYLQLLNRRYKDKLDSDAREFVDFAVDGSTRMSRLITELLDFSRINTRGKPPEPVAMDSVLQRAVDNLQVAIRDSGAQITHDPLPTVRGDATQLVQLLQNLVGNAIKFRKPDRPIQVCIKAEKKDDDCVFSVKDNGIGIETQYSDKIFRIFQRLHSRGEYPGTGIGLAICKKIVERHGGRIWVESRLDEGSTFFFTIGSSRAAR